MSSPARNKKTLAVSGLIVVLVSLVVYLSIARELDKREAVDTPAVTGPPACPECPPGKPLPLFKPIDFTVDFYGMSYSGNSANLIDRHVLYFGAYEKDVLYLMRDISRAFGDGVFVDVGANTGLHSLYMSKHASTVHAFEPYEPVLARLRAAIARNEIGNIVVHPVGLGDQRSSVLFHKPPNNNLGSGSFVSDFIPGNRLSTELQIVVGDEALAEAGVERVALIKIDVEGYEKFALRGLRKTLTASRPFVVVELTTGQQKELFQSADDLRLAFPEGYRVLRIDSSDGRNRSGQYKLTGYNFDSKWVGQRNLLVYPDENHAALMELAKGAPAEGG